MVFSESTNNSGIVERARRKVGLDSIQLPTWAIVNSCNDWSDFVTGIAIGADKRFQWDDTNHTKLPEGKTPLTINVSDYSFLTDEQGNRILTLIGVSRYDAASGYYIPLDVVDRNSSDVDVATFGMITGTPTAYDKISDNVIRLNYKPSATVAAGLKFYFQRSPFRFVTTDTTREPGFADIIHSGFVIKSAYDAAVDKVPSKIGILQIDLQKERANVEQYFADRNQDSDIALSSYQDNSWQL